MAKAFAIDLGATSAKCAFFDNEKVIKTFVFDTTNKERLLEKISEQTFKVAAENNINMEELDFVGIAVCGIVDKTTGTVVYSTNLGWKNYPTIIELETLFKNKNIVVLNDAKAATYGEWSGSLNREPESMALFTIGTGVGGGAILNRKLVFGDNTGLPSEPGHGGGFQSQFQCDCGLIGCLDPVSSATGIERRLRQVGATSTGPLGKVHAELKDNLHIIDIADLFKAGDPEIVEIFRENLEPLAKCISVLIHFFDLSMIVIGGGPSNLGEPFLELIRKDLEKYVLPDFYSKIKISSSKLGDLVGAWGVYKYGVDNIVNK